MIDLRCFCNPDKPHCALPCRVDDWVVASDGFVMVAERAPSSFKDYGEWLLEASSRKTDSDKFKNAFLKNLKAPRQFRLKLQIIVDWAIAADFDGYLKLSGERSYSEDACDHCGVTSPSIDGYDRQYINETVFDRILVRRCVYPLRLAGGTVVEVSAVKEGPLVISSHDTVIIVMPQRGEDVGGGAVGKESLDITPYRRAALGFET